MRGIIAWFARNHVAANLVMLIMIIGGFVALPAMQQKSFPDINVEVIQVTVPYLGAAPEEVERGVCLRIEDELQGIDGIETLSTVAAEGACNVGAELISNYPIDRALSEIKNAVDSISTFPDETEKPIVSHYQIRRTAMRLALSGDTDERSLKLIGERIRQDISALDGVTQVELRAVRADEISIEVSETSLRRHNLTFDDVVRAVRRSSLDLPGGAIRTAEGDILVRTKGQAYAGYEFQEIVVLTRADGTRLRLGDIANVVDGFEEDHRFARFDGDPALLIIVYRVGEQKVLDLVKTVRAYVEDVRPDLPEGINLTVWADGSRSLRDRLDILTRNGIQGFVLVFVVLSCFLRLRLAGWVSLGVPVAFLGALATFPVLGISIDVISIFAFILVLGLLVDDAIVVGENVHTHQQRGEDPLDSAIAGTQEVSVPVIFGVLTTIAAFLPLLLAPGTMGQIFSGIGVVVVLCLIFSLLESQMVLPSHLGHVRMAERSEPSNAVSMRWRRFQDTMSGGMQRLIDEKYRPALERALEWRYTTVSVGLLLLLWTLAIVGTGAIRFSFFPPVESDYVSASITMPIGTPVARTAAVVQDVEAAALRMRERLNQEYGDLDEPMVKHVMTTVGAQPSTGGRGSGSSSGGSHLGEVSIELLSGEGRPIESAAVVRVWREEVPEIPDAESVTFSSALFRVGDPISLRLQSPDVEELVHAAEALKEHLRAYPGTFDVKDSFEEGKRELRLAILPSAEVLGLSLEDLARQVRQAFYGEEAQRIQRDREDVRVMVRFPAAERRSLGDLENMRIRTPDGGEVPFHSVARVEAGRGYSTIRRIDRQRVITVAADLDLSKGNANEIMRDLRTNFMPQLMADHAGLNFAPDGEQREQRKVQEGMQRTLPLALILIFALLAVPLRSYSQPLIIMSVIPFGLVGAIGGHLLMGRSLSMMSVFGIVALSGVVVNASLVMVHYVNTRRALGASVRQAVREAGAARFRPIVLTSMTTFAGLTPLLLERSVSAQFLIPMAISLGFGVAFSSLITLFLVPSAYMILEDLRHLFSRTPPDEEGGEVTDIRLRAAGSGPGGIRSAG
ncbi:MAG: efflux RND transporter permease subunit [Deltaproteobacteria bacterium]|nr:efflux RND transporter permease subunit [Deltaproteobacteria bacterium]